jgi:putative glutamine amidotransferase
MVNSIHHQAIKTLGDSLIATAYAEQDAIIEVIESSRYPSQLLAVQWHPETMLSSANASSQDQLKLFATLCS